MQTKVLNSLFFITMTKKAQTVNERIDEIMLERGKSKQELAAITGKNVVTFDRILNGTTTPSFSTVKAIADALGCPVDYLLNGVGPTRIEKAGENPWRDALVAELKDQIQFLRDTIRDMRTRATNFPQALNGTGFRKKSLRAAA